MKFFQYLSALFHLIGSKHYTTYFSQFFVQLMGRTLGFAALNTQEQNLAPVFSLPWGHHLVILNNA